jgi:hypothetical protein
MSDVEITSIWVSTSRQKRLTRGTLVDCISTKTFSKEGAR